MNLLYVRHGKTQGNAEKIYVGRIESPLLPEGIESGIRVGKQLHDSGEQVEAIYSSNLSRQLDTAKLIATEIGYPEDDIIITDLLLERAGGDFEGKPITELIAANEEEQVALGAESFMDLSSRAVAMVERARNDHPNGTVLLVGSAAIGEMMRAMVKYGDHTKMFDDGPLPNSELVRLI